jgi:acyl dehydratase
MSSGRVFDARERRFGWFLEDYQVEDHFIHWPGRTITEAEDHLFCMMTMAASPIHVDVEYGREETEFGRNVVVGTFVYSVLLGMSVPDISGRAIANLGVRELRHVRPLFHGDTLYGRSTVVSVRNSRSRPNQGVLTVATVGVNQHDEVVCEFERAVLLPSREMDTTSD